MLKISYILVDSLRELSDEQLYQKLLSLSALGYQGIELNLTEPPGIDFDLLEQRIGDLNLVIPSFMTGEAYRDGLCLSSPELSIRQQTVSRLIGYMDTAQRFDAVLAIGLLQGLRTDEPHTDRANDRIVDCLREVAVAAVDKGVEIVLEPVNHLQVGFNNSVEEVCEIVDRVDSPSLKPMADTLHMNIEEKDPLTTIRKLGTRLRHFHFCDSNGAQLGTGNIDLAGVWETLLSIGYQRFVSVKIYRKADWEEGARAAMEFLSGLPTTAVQPA